MGICWGLAWVLADSHELQQQVTAICSEISVRPVVQMSVAVCLMLCVLAVCGHQDAQQEIVNDLVLLPVLACERPYPLPSVISQGMDSVPSAAVVMPVFASTDSASAEAACSAPEASCADLA